MSANPMKGSKPTTLVSQSHHIAAPNLTLTLRLANQNVCMCVFFTEYVIFVLGLFFLLKDPPLLFPQHTVRVGLGLLTMMT